MLTAFVTTVSAGECSWDSLGANSVLAASARATSVDVVPPLIQII